MPALTHGATYRIGDQLVHTSYTGGWLLLLLDDDGEPVSATPGDLVGYALGPRGVWREYLLVETVGGLEYAYGAEAPVDVGRLVEEDATTESFHDIMSSLEWEWTQEVSE